MSKGSNEASKGVCPVRRGLLRRLGVVSLALISNRVVRAHVADQRALAFSHTHTGESFSAVYFEGGHYQAEALQKINILLRDFRTDTVHPIDPQVLDRLFSLQLAAGGNEAFEVISGYRSPGTNAALRRRSGGVAEHSLHMEGRAIDVRLPGCVTGKLAALARLQSVGGVGFYRVSDFVHLDTGRVRIWGDPLDA